MAQLNDCARALQKARATIVLDHPFFASPMLKHGMKEDTTIPTMAVTNDGTIYFNPSFVATLTNDELVFAICHEILHYLSGHGIRLGDREPERWNVAGDMWINDTQKRSGFTLIEGCIYVPGSADKTVEDIYAALPEDNGGDGSGEGQGQGGGSTGQSSDPLAGDVDPSGESDELSQAQIEELDAQRKLDVAEAAQVAKMKGKLPGALAAFAAATVDSKVPWWDVLERYMTERVKNDYSWSRPNRRYAPEFYLPTMDGVGAMGEVVVQVDISGSISPKEIEHYNGHIKAIVEQCHPSRVHVLYTDTRVQKHDVFDKPEDVEITHRSGGGTDMRAGFDYIAAQGIEPEVIITLTDGYTPFPENTATPSIWCCSTKDIAAPCGETIHFTVS